MDDNEELSIAVLGKEGNFSIEPSKRDVHSENGLVKLSITKEQRQQLSALTQYVPNAAAAGTLANCYVAKFPDGLQHSLMALKQGGFMSAYQNEAGKIAGTASLFKTAGQAAVLGAFTVMAAVSGQFFLTCINKEMAAIRQDLDRILEFLYGDKKAELMSEVAFVKYAYENYSSILWHDEQRIATITNLQVARKVAMKDIEFYMNDLNSIIESKDTIDIMTDRALQIKESLDLSIQLYGMSYVLEVYYSQNCNVDYLDHVEHDMSIYIDKSEKRMLSNFSKLSGIVANYKGKMAKKTDKSLYEHKISDVVDSLNTGSESAIRKSFREGLRKSTLTEECYITRDGDIYLRAS